jgi:hypothetical protein
MEVIAGIQYYYCVHGPTLISIPILAIYLYEYELKTKFAGYTIAITLGWRP